VQAGIQPIKRTLGVDPPVGGPHTHYVPSQTTQDLLPQFVAIACCCAAMVGSSITLYAGQIASRCVGIYDAKVDAKRRYTDLWLNAPTALSESRGYGLFKGTVESAEATPVGFCQRAGAAFGEL